MLIKQARKSLSKISKVSTNQINQNLRSDYTPVKVSIERLAGATAASNTYERCITVHAVWQMYHNHIQNKWCYTTQNIFSFFFYFLTGFLRVGLRQTLSFRLSDYYINRDVLDLHIGQTHFLYSNSNNALVNAMSSSPGLFINPLIFVRLGRYYVDRETFVSYVNDCRGLFEVNAHLTNMLMVFARHIQNEFSSIYQGLVSYYQSMTFSY